MLQKAKGNLVTHHHQKKRKDKKKKGNTVIQWFNTLLQTILAGVEDTSVGKGLAKDRDGKVKKATQDERMASGACCSWLDFER